MKLIEDGYGLLYVFSGQEFKYKSQFSEAENSAKSQNTGLWGSCSTQKNRYGNYEVTN
jgi:endonuclease YncB( thermonuclease family)